jgi:hypothetical protein
VILDAAEPSSRVWRIRGVCVAADRGICESFLTGFLFAGCATCVCLCFVVLEG